MELNQEPVAYINIGYSVILVILDRLWIETIKLICHRMSKTVC